MCFHQKFIITKIYKDLDSRIGFVVCGKPHVTFLIIRALYVFSASTNDVISHLIPITSMSAEVVDGGRCLFYFLIFFFMPPKELRWHIKIEPSVCPSVSPSVTNRVSAISHELLKQI